MGSKSVVGPEQRKKPALDAVAGAVAGAVSRFVVGPLDVVKIRMQVQLEPVRRGVPSKYTGVGQAIRCVLRDEGIVVRPESSALLLSVAASRFTMRCAEC